MPKEGGDPLSYKEKDRGAPNPIMSYATGTCKFSRRHISQNKEISEQKAQ
jgi:hypothetical protein